MDLVSYISSWLASTLNVEENVAPNLSQAYRLGHLNNPTRIHPRDIIITFMSIREKNRVLEYAKEKGFLQHQLDKMQVFLI